MKVKQLFVLSSIAATLSSNAALVLSDIGTLPTDTAPNFTSYTFSGAGDSQSYLVSAVNDGVTAWHQDSGLDGDNNVAAVTVASSIVTLESVTGTGSVSLNDGGANFIVETTGDVSSFTISVVYYDDSTGNTLDMAGRLVAGGIGSRSGPYVHLLANTTNFSVHDVSLGMLDENQNTITGMGYTPILDDTWGYATDDATPTDNTSTTGLVTYDMDGAGDIANIHYFNDATPSWATDADDIFSGVVFEVTSDSGSFTSGASWNVSLDGSIQADSGVPIPEPTAFSLLSLSALALCVRRKR